jgi:HK97 family phage prohead protease
MLHKTFTAKAEATANAGEFTALVSAFGNEDSQGDVIQKGAFSNSLGEWAAKGRPIPVVWAHQFSDPDNFLGQYTAAKETDAGLELTGQMDMSHPKAARVHDLMQKGLIVEFSISGMVRDFEVIEKDGGDSWFPGMTIKDIDLWEAGPCFKGANPATELISIKSLTAGKDLGVLKDTHAKLGRIIAAAEAEEPAPPTESAEPAAEKASALTPAVRALLELSQ